MFEKASRLKLRFYYKGLCSTEDLWDLPVTALDYIFKGLNKKLKEQKEESLLETKTKEDEILELQVEIVKHIVHVKILEAKLQEDKVLKSAKKQKIMELIAEKQDASLKDMSIEDLQKMIDEL